MLRVLRIRFRFGSEVECSTEGSSRYNQTGMETLVYAPFYSRRIFSVSARSRRKFEDLCGMLWHHCKLFCALHTEFRGNFLEISVRYAQQPGYVRRWSHCRLFRLGWPPWLGRQRRPPQVGLAAGDASVVLARQEGC